MPATVTNANIDALAAAVPAPQGPLTRVTDVANLPTPNSEMTLEFTAATGETVYMTYEQLQNADVVERILGYVGGITTKIALLSAQIDAVKALADVATTYDDYKGVIEALRSIEELQGYY